MNFETKPFVPKSLLRTIVKPKKGVNIFCPEYRKQFFCVSGLDTDFENMGNLRRECERVTGLPFISCTLVRDFDGDSTGTAVVFCGSEQVAKRGLTTLSGKTLRLVTGSTKQEDSKEEEETEEKTEESKHETQEETPSERQFKDVVVKCTSRPSRLTQIGLAFTVGKDAQDEVRDLCIKYGGALKIETEKIKRKIPESENEEGKESTQSTSGVKIEKPSQNQQLGNGTNVESQQPPTSSGVVIVKPTCQKNESGIKIEKPQHKEKAEEETKVNQPETQQKQKTEPLSEIERVAHLTFSLPLAEDFPFDVRGNRFIIRFTLHENYPHQLPDVEVLNTDFPEKIRSTIVSAVLSRCFHAYRGRTRMIEGLVRWTVNHLEGLMVDDDITKSYQNNGIIIMNKGTPKTEAKKGEAKKEEEEY